MATKAIVLTAVLSAVGSFLSAFLTAFLMLVITRCWDRKVDQTMERLTELTENQGARPNDDNARVTSGAGLEQQITMTSIEEETRRMKWGDLEAEVKSLQIKHYKWKTNYGGVRRCLFFWKRFTLGLQVFKKFREVTQLLDQGYLKPVAAPLPPAAPGMQTSLPPLAGQELMPSTSRVQVSFPPPVAQALPLTSSVRGMDSNRDQILQYLNDDVVNIIGIWGMGGVGKTTLLKMINNYFAYNKLLWFHYVIFVVASKRVNPEELQKKILKNLQLTSEKDDDINSGATLLFNFLKNKKILLLLDDLWEHVDLFYLGIPLGQGTCKVIFTTRSKVVCGSMEADRKLKVGCLNIGEAWKLFEEKVSDDMIKADLNISHLAEEVVKECGGLPLALITIAREMSSKKTLMEWECVVSSLRNSMLYNILDMWHTLLMILEFSYQNLKKHKIRECFLMCSMWPKGCEISQHELIICWMGLGLIDDWIEINEAYDKGHFIIESLIGECLLERCGGNYAVKMHNVLRELAFWIISEHEENKNKWMVQSGGGLKECLAEKWGLPHRISLMYNNIEVLPDDLPKGPNLSVITLYSNPSLWSAGGLFVCFKSLTYLDLGRTDIRELPEEVGELVNLKFLKLDHTYIKDLPYEIRFLVNLSYLYLGYTLCLKSIHWESISCLSRLKVLDLFHSAGAVEQESQCCFEALKWLDGRLMGLGISIDAVQALKWLSQFSTVSVVKMEMKNLQDTKSLDLLAPAFLGSKPTTDSLRELEINDCQSLEVLIVDSLHSDQRIRRLEGLPRLEKLELRDLTLLEKIVWRGVTPREYFPSLYFVYIRSCPKLKDISWVLQLPNLDSLYLGDCSGLEMVIGEAEEGSSAGEIADIVEEPILAFPKLRELSLWNLPNLGRLCSTTVQFPSLEEISVHNCPKLKKLPFQGPNIPNKLQHIGGSAEWWEHLEWEDDRTKPLLQKHFKALVAGTADPQPPRFREF